MIDGAEVVRLAREQIGTPWMHQARVPFVAMDCAGLLVYVARATGSVAPDFDVGGYSRAPDGSMLAVCRQHMDEIAELELGAIIIIATEREPQHVGIVGDYRHGGWSIIHSSSAARPARVLETRLMWSNAMQLRGVFRLRSGA